MDWVSKLEKKYGRYAISGIMKYIIVLQVAGFAIMNIMPEFYLLYLQLDARAILNGQIWRVVTFLLDPPITSTISISGLIFLFFALYLYYMIGQSLESIWGAFRFNLYLIGGVLFHVIAVLIVYAIFDVNLFLDTTYLYLSLYFAFAFSFPEMQLLLFFVIPVKMKYLGMLNGVFFGYTILQGILPAYVNSTYGVTYQARALAAGVSVLNFLIFFFTSKSFKRHTPKEMMRRKKFKNDLKRAKVRPTTYANGAKHKCAVCGRTELDDPTLEFRYCSKCNGNYEYCQDHLFTHEHMK